MIEPQLFHCFICKQLVGNHHHFYAGLCDDCGELNYHKRNIRANLSGQQALVTGARIGIGFAVAKQLLRDGARVIATTRFAHDAARRFAAEPDFPEWQENLSIYRLDLQQTTMVEAFTSYLIDSIDKLDILINNAAQTIQRPASFYRNLLRFESAAYRDLSEPLQFLLKDNESFFHHCQTALSIDNTGIFDDQDEQFFPADQYTADEQQLDLRPFNSWMMRDDQVDSNELATVFAVNTIAPFILNSRLKSIMARKGANKSYIINVSSVEGQFSDGNKSFRHPHTNMAKAALNMMTRTCARDYQRLGILINSVDPGWVSYQHPYPEQSRMLARGLKPPFDPTDAAARICDPIYQHINNGIKHSGRFFKDFVVTQW